MKQEAILIFGGGENQLTLIKASKARGYFTVVIDPNESAPGKEIADAFEGVAPKDFDATCKVVENYNIKGVATAQMENPLLLMAEIAEKYNFIFPSFEQIKRARNKWMMKQAFLEAAVPCAKGKLFTKSEAITIESLAEYSYPLIIKPIDAFSSRGVLKVDNFDEIQNIEFFTRSFSSDNSIIVEEFIEGREFSIESITYKENTHIIQYTEKIITDYPYTVEMGHTQPADLTENEKSLIDKIVINAIKALKLDNCATHTELKLTNEGPKIIEIGARLGGDYISSYLTLNSTGVNMDAAVADMAMGNKPELTKTLNQFTGIFYFHLGAGNKVVKLGNWNEVLNFENVIYANLLVKQDEVIAGLTDSAKRSGFVIVKAESKEKLLIGANEAIKNILANISINYFVEVKDDRRKENKIKTIHN